MSSKRRARLVSPLARARNTALEFLVRPFKRLSAKTRFGITFLIFVVVTTLLLGDPFSRVPTENYKEGEVVRRTIHAPTDISGVDATETERRKREAMESVRPVFIYDSGRADRIVQSFRATWEELKKRSGEAGSELTWPGDGGTEAARAFAAHQFDDSELDNLTRVLHEVASGMIYEDDDQPLFKEEITLVRPRFLCRKAG
jgi:membrane-associated HD superfamily phosphohydrolase